MHVLIHFDLLYLSWYLFIVWLYITIGNWFYSNGHKTLQNSQKKKKKNAAKCFATFSCNTFFIIKYVLEWNHMVERTCTNLSHIDVEGLIILIKILKNNLIIMSKSKRTIIRIWWCEKLLVWAPRWYRWTKALASSRDELVSVVLLWLVNTDGQSC